MARRKFCSRAVNFASGRGGARDAAGNIYGTTANGGSGLGVVWEITPSAKLLGIRVGWFA